MARDGDFYTTAKEAQREIEVSGIHNSGIIVWMGIPVGVRVCEFSKQYIPVTRVNNNNLKMEWVGNNFYS